MVPVLEAVPNFSEGRDLEVVRGLVDAVRAEGAEVLDWSADPDHHRSVITLVGTPEDVEAAVLAAARVAVASIDLSAHDGIHPRIGALDVLPLVPLQGVSFDDANVIAHRVGRALGDMGLPVYYYGRASDPPGRGLAELRQGGFESLVKGFPSGREPDVLPGGWQHPGVHPSAGATCVGVRPLLLAWNVFVEGLTLERVRSIALEIRESGGGFVGVRALGLELPRQGRYQISMNVEDLERTSPFEVFRAIEEGVGAAGGRIECTEVIGMVPDALVLPAASDRLRLLDTVPDRLLSARLVEHLARRHGADIASFLEGVDAAGDEIPDHIRLAARRLARSLAGNSFPGADS